MDISIVALGIVGIGTFLGVWRVLGSLIGRQLAINKKEAEKRLIEKIADPIIKQAIIDKMKMAEDLLEGQVGQDKLNWVINSLTAIIPTNLDDVIIRDCFQGVYDGYKDEIKK